MTPTSERLLDIVRTQTDIAQLGPDLGAVMTLAAERVQQMTGASSAVVELAEGDEMVYRAATGSAADLLGLRLARSTSLSGLCIETNEVLSSEDSETDPRVDREACRKVGLRSMLVAPLIHESDAVGVLKVCSDSVAAFSADDAATLQLMAGFIASAMYHANATSELYVRATHDPLTGLPNRALFYDRARQALHNAHRSGGTVALLNVDLDGLKPINDTHGHSAGDAAIIEAGNRMRQAVRRSDTVARIGGDEYAILLVPIRNREDAENHAKKLTEAVGARFTFEGTPLALGASIGVALYPEDGMSLPEIIDCADKAMYRSKARRKAAAPQALSLT